MKMLEQEADSTDDNAPTGFRFNEHYCYKFERTGYEPLNCTFAGRPDHIPLYRRDDLTKLMGLLMVREPKSRIISAFLDNVHIEGFANRTSGREMKDKLIAMDLEKDVPHEVNLLKKAQMYVHHHALYGHQVKMLLGLPVLDLSQPRTKHIEAVVARAVDRMTNFFFVGIFDEYARSLKVFHEMANVGECSTLFVQSMYMYTVPFHAYVRASVGCIVCRYNWLASKFAVFTRFSGHIECTWCLLCRNGIVCICMHRYDSNPRGAVSAAQDLRGRQSLSDGAP